MYLGGGVLALIVIILLIVWLFEPGGAGPGSATRT